MQVFTNLIEDHKAILICKVRNEVTKKKKKERKL